MADPTSYRIPTVDGVPLLIRSALDNDTGGVRAEVARIAAQQIPTGGGTGTAAWGSLLVVVASGGTWAAPSRPAGARFLWVPDDTSAPPTLAEGMQYGDLIVIDGKVETMTPRWVPPAALLPIVIPDGSRFHTAPGAAKFSGPDLVGQVVADVQDATTANAIRAAWREEQWQEGVRRAAMNVCSILYDRMADVPMRHDRVTLRFTAGSYLAQCIASESRIEFGTGSRTANTTASYVTHEVAHLFMRTVGYGTTQHVAMVTEGIADWVLIQLGYHNASAHRPAGGGTNWYDGYRTTSFFFDYVERSAPTPTPGFVKSLLKTMTTTTWTPAVITGLNARGLTVEQLWTEYKAWLGAPIGGGDPPPDPPPPVTTTLPFTDRTNVTFTGASQTSNYHVWANGFAAGAKLLIWLHGDGKYEHDNPTSSYVFGGTNGLVAQARARGYIVVSAKSPDTTGSITWWESGSTRASYLAALLDHLTTGYATDKTKTVIAGYSGGAQQASQFFMAHQWGKLEQGGLVIPIAGGEAPDNSPTYSTAVKTNVRMHWAVGANDTAANSPERFDARGSAEYGENWFRTRGFRTSIQLIAGKGHALDGMFGGIVAAQLDLGM